MFRENAKLNSSMCGMMCEMMDMYMCMSVFCCASTKNLPEASAALSEGRR